MNLQKLMRFYIAASQTKAGNFHGLSYEVSDMLRMTHNLVLGVSEKLGLEDKIKDIESEFATTFVK